MREQLEVLTDRQPHSSVARPVLADQTDELARADLECCAAQHLDPASTAQG